MSALSLLSVFLEVLVTLKEFGRVVLEGAIVALPRWDNAVGHWSVVIRVALPSIRNAQRSSTQSLTVWILPEVYVGAAAGPWIEVLEFGAGR